MAATFIAIGGIGRRTIENMRCYLNNREKCFLTIVIDASRSMFERTKGSIQKRIKGAARIAGTNIQYKKITYRTMYGGSADKAENVIEKKSFRYDSRKGKENSDMNRNGRINNAICREINDLYCAKKSLDSRGTMENKREKVKINQQRKRLISPERLWNGGDIYVWENENQKAKWLLYDFEKSYLCT